MKHLSNFYVVDSLTESVVGSFKAINFDMAKKILDESYKKSDKLQQIGDSLKLYRDDCVIDVAYETYDEVLEHCVPAHWTLVTLEDNEHE